MRIWLLIFVLILATGVGVLLHEDPGYALFAYKGWTVEMPLWIAILAMLVLFIVTLFGFSLVQRFFSTIDNIKTWWHYRHKKTARTQTDKGLLELAAGRWKNAERLLIKSAHFSETPLINYLSAAKAAEEMGAENRRDHYLEQASIYGEDSALAIGLTQAQLQLTEGQLDKSLKMLQQLYQQAPDNPKVLKYLYMAYEAKNDYEAIFKLLPALRKQSVFKIEVLDQLEIKLYQGLLPKILNEDPAKGIQHLLQFWKNIPRTTQNNPVLIAQYCRLLINQGLYSEADTVLKKALQKGLDNHLIYLYGLTKHQPKKQLAFAESFLPTNKDNAELLFTLGKLCIANQLWGKARDYLEQSLALKPTPEIYQELAKIYDQMGLHEKRDHCYKQGLLSAIT